MRLSATKLLEPSTLTCISTSTVHICFPCHRLLRTLDHPSNAFASAQVASEKSAHGHNHVNTQWYCSHVLRMLGSIVLLRSRPFFFLKLPASGVVRERVLRHLVELVSAQTLSPDRSHTRRSPRRFPRGRDGGHSTHARDQLFAQHITPELAEEGSPVWAMGEESDGDEDDTPPHADADELELIDMPSAVASAPPMSNLEWCIALRLVSGAGPR